MTKAKIFIFIIILIVILIVGGIYLYNYLCITGWSYGNFCLTRPTTIDLIAGWNTLNNKEYGFSLKYPADFFDANQQPKLLVGDCNYNVFPDKCPNINDIVIKDQAAEGGDLTVIESNLSNQNYWDTPSGKKQTINSVPYCLYATGDSAAGHAFNYYYFATVKNKKCLVVYLATATTNCDFYLPLEKGNTEQAKNYNDCLTTNKNQPIILNEIINTFQFK